MLHDILHQVINSTAGQIGISLTAILSGKWFFDFIRNKIAVKRDKVELAKAKIEVAHEKVDLDNLKVKNLLNQIVDMQKLIDKLQDRVNAITSENISLKQQVYELTDKSMQIELRLNRIIVENKKKDKELQECLEKLAKK